MTLRTFGLRTLRGVLFLVASASTPRTNCKYSAHYPSRWASTECRRCRQEHLMRILPPLRLYYHCRCWHLRDHHRCHHVLQFPSSPCSLPLCLRHYPNHPFQPQPHINNYCRYPVPNRLLLCHHHAPPLSALLPPCSSTLPCHGYHPGHKGFYRHRGCPGCVHSLTYRQQLTLRKY